MLNLTNITVSFGGRDLYKNISFQINPKDKIGIVGKNGAGKSTMLKLITGDQKPNSGTINTTNSLSIGYLPQEINVSSSEEILNEVLNANKQLLTINSRLNEINLELTNRVDYESDEYMQLLSDLSDLNEQLMLLDGDNQLKDAELILKGLGFDQTDFDRNLSEYSGGWQMRVVLTKILLTMPDLILLDEPTNHLDIESILWLEEFFINYPGSLLMVSHDKMFLDNVTNKTLEIVNGKSYDYKAPYSKFLQLRQERIELQTSAKKNQGS